MFIGSIIKCGCCGEEYLIPTGYTASTTLLAKALKYDDLCPICEDVIVVGVRSAIKTLRGGLEVVAPIHIGEVTTDQPTTPELLRLVSLEEELGYVEARKPPQGKHLGAVDE